MSYTSYSQGNTQKELTKCGWPAVAAFATYELPPALHHPAPSSRHTAFMTTEMRAALQRVADRFPTAIITGRSQEKVRIAARHAPHLRACLSRTAPRFTTRPDGSPPPNPPTPHTRFEASFSSMTGSSGSLAPTGWRWRAPAAPSRLRRGRRR